MEDKTSRLGAKPTREERLAAKLRENLHRRKEQGRKAQVREAVETPPDLSKPDPSR